MITKTELADRIRYFRNSKNFSQAEVGKALGKSHVAVSDIELGKTEVSVKDLSILANLFGMTIAELAEGKQTYYIQHRDAKNISPEEKKIADKSTEDFIKLARQKAEERNNK